MERQIRLSTAQIEDALKKAGVIDDGENIKRVWIEPGELILEISY